MTIGLGDCCEVVAVRYWYRVSGRASCYKVTRQHTLQAGRDGMQIICSLQHIKLMVGQLDM